MIGLALIMDIIKAGSATLINLSHRQRVEIIGASHRMTTESFLASAPLKHTHTHNTKRSSLEESIVRFEENLSLPPITASQKQQNDQCQLKEG